MSSKKLTRLRWAVVPAKYLFWEVDPGCSEEINGVWPTGLRSAVSGTRQHCRCVSVGRGGGEKETSETSGGNTGSKQSPMSLLCSLGISDTTQQRASEWLSTVLSSSLMTPAANSEWPAPGRPVVTASECEEAKRWHRPSACAPWGKSFSPFSGCHCCPLSLPPVVSYLN